MDGKARLEAFERMLADVKCTYGELNARLDSLRRENKTKTATFRQYLGEKMTCQYILSLYQSYGLTEPTHGEVLK